MKDSKAAIDGVFTFLDEIMHQFNDLLTEANFKLIYDAIWTEIVALVDSCLDKDATTQAAAAVSCILLLSALF